MIVAVAPVRVMQMPVHEVVRVARVWNRFMAAACTVCVPTLMAATGVRWRALIRVALAHTDFMAIGMAVVHVVHMAIMQVICVAVVLDGRMSAARSVCVRVSFVCCASHNPMLLPKLGTICSGSGRSTLRCGR